MAFRVCSFATALIAGLFAAANSAGAQQWRSGDRDWELLGTVVQEARVERQVIDVGRREGRFGRIGIAVLDNDAEILDLKVVYGNGETEDVRVRETFRAGSRSRPLDLGGRDRFIRQIEVTYRSRGPVKIEVYGQQQQRRERWEELGCARIGFLDDKDEIRVGRREGRFEAVKLKVENQSVRLKALRIIYSDGEREDIRVGAIVPAGAETRPLDLGAGRRGRGIDRVELFYLPQITIGGRKANVCLLGRG